MTKPRLATRSTHLSFVHTLRDDEAEWLRRLAEKARRLREFNEYAEAVIEALIASPPEEFNPGCRE
jgi:hypothetical protein